MWKCKHCNKEFNSLTLSEKANHSRWCTSNPNRNNWNKAQGTINQYGNLKDYEVTCLHCSTKFVVSEREKLHPQKDKYYCSRSCANNRQEWWNNNISNYRTIAFKHWAYECVICKFNKIVAIHHIDGNHNNNDPTNLVPLCPNHHEMVHSKWVHEVTPLIEEIVREKWGIGASGNTSPLHGEVKGSTPLSSTT